MHRQFSNGSGEGQKGSNTASTTPSTRGYARNGGVILERTTNQLNTTGVALPHHLRLEGAAVHPSINATVAIDEGLRCSANGEEESDEEVDLLEQGTLDSLHGFSEGSDETI